jgi:hypothetical protein
LTKTEEEETIIINRPDRSTYPKEKSVLRSGATPEDMGNQSRTGLAKRSGIWHIDKTFRGTRILESTSTGAAGCGGTKRAI